MKPTVRYPEAIALGLAIAAALGGWASTVLERAADPEKVCAQQLMGVDDRWQVAGVAFPGYRGCLFPHCSATIF
jgi:hypothetical protein